MAFNQQRGQLNYLEDGVHLPGRSPIEVVQQQLDAVLHSLSNPVLSAAERAAAVAEVRRLFELLTGSQTAVHPSEPLMHQHQYEQLLNQYQQERQLMQITQKLRQSLNPQEILAQTAVAAQQLLQADHAVVYQLVDDWIHDPAKTQTNPQAIPVTDSVAATIVTATPSSAKTRLGTTLNTAQVSELVAFCQQHIPLGFDGSSAPIPPALVPLVQPGMALLTALIQRVNKISGLIVAYQQSQRIWQWFEIDILQQVAQEAAIALQHSELYQQAYRLNLDLEREVQQRTEQLKKALDYESMLKRITERVRDSLNEEHILQAVVQELTVILKLAGCNAALYDLKQGTSTIHYDYTESIPASQGRVAHMQHFPEIYQQLQRGWSFQFCSLLPNPVRGQVAMLACPILVDLPARDVNQSVLGDLWLIHQKDHQFEEPEIRLVQQVANQCAIAIRQARLYQAAQGQVQELAELNRLKDEFLSTVSHELRTPITNVKMAIHMLRAAAPQDNWADEKWRDYFSILEQEASREADLINDLLDLQQLQAMPRRVELETIPLPEWLSQIIAPFQPRFVARQQSFTVHYPADLPPITAESASLRRVLVELLNNACKYTAPGGQISLKVDCIDYADSDYADKDYVANNVGTREVAHESDPISGVAFMICNQATIPATELPKIFDKFYRCPNADPWKQGGTGLGLALVQKLVERLQGELQVTSTDGWTKFTLRLPSSLAGKTRS
ncbi:MAG: GAF domain-containing sensor histidine kinase [Leptolyngbya sp. IPPAS B-1204]|nr:MAG: sensor histidine kinase [Leptolyngbya sp. IPPAS B-1204]